MRQLFLFTLLFSMCLIGFSQKHQYNEKTWTIGKGYISKIEINERHILLTLDSNFVKRYKNEDILKYQVIKFDFYHKNIMLMNDYAAILMPNMTASIQENKLENSLIWVRIWHLSRYDRNVISFKRSIKKNFSKEMIILQDEHF